MVTAIFQKSVDSGELPEGWRDGNMAPVYKKGDRHTPAIRSWSILWPFCGILGLLSSKSGSKCL